MTLEGLFGLTVMFFELTNSPVTFQIIINEILWDLINTREVVSFIDNIIIKTEEKKEHDEIIEEVVKRLAENDLCVNSSHPPTRDAACLPSVGSTHWQRCPNLAHAT